MLPSYAGFSKASPYTGQHHLAVSFSQQGLAIIHFGECHHPLREVPKPTVAFWQRTKLRSSKFVFPGDTALTRIIPSGSACTERRDKREEVRVWACVSISLYQLDSVLLCAKASKGKGKGRGLWHTLPILYSLSSIHPPPAAHTTGWNVRLLWALVVWEKQFSSHFVGVSGRACRTKAVINSQLQKGGCSCFERFPCKLCRYAQNFNGCLPAKMCHQKSK